MASFVAPSLLAAVSPLPPSATPSPSGRGTAAKNESSFSRQLEQSRQTHARERARPAPPPKPPAVAEGAAPADAAQRPTQPQAAVAKEPARNARASPPRERAAAAQAESTPTQTQTETVVDTEADGCTPADGSATGTIAPAPTTPWAAATLPTESPSAGVPGLTAQAQIQNQTPAQTQTQAPPSAADGAAQALSLNATTSPAAPTAPVRLPTQAAERIAQEPAAFAAPTEPGAWQQAQAAAVLAESTSRLHELPDARQAEPAAPSDRTLATPGLAGLPIPAPPFGKPGEVASVNLATPTTSAEFRAALGAQVSWFARAGVQQAELHLNPADMGPVSIQIVLDGQQAQVNFGADSALTRQIIESGMPELAGALRDAGLTLTGGGVSQHSGGQRQDANAGGGASSARPGTGTATDAGTDPQVEQAKRSAVRSSAGGLDLYA